MIRRTFILLFLIISSSLLADPPPVNALGYETATGLRGSYDDKAKVFKAVYRRINKNIAVDSIILDQPFYSLSSWAAFMPIDDKFLLTGEMVLFQDEVNPLLSLFLDNAITISSLDTHYFFDTPRTYFLTLSGTGSLAELGKTVKSAFDMIKTFRQNNPQVASTFPGKVGLSNSSLNPAALDKIFGMKGEYKDGMLKYVIGRSVTRNQVTIGAEMGVSSRAIFSGIDANAAVDGDVALLESELQSTLKDLRKADFTIMSIDRRQIGASPQLFFVHFSARGKAGELAKVVKAAIRA
jgi:hypothetical protein